MKRGAHHWSCVSHICISCGATRQAVVNRKESHRQRGCRAGYYHDERDIFDVVYTQQGRICSYARLIRGLDYATYRTSTLPAGRIPCGWSTHETWRQRLKRARKRGDRKALARLFAQGDHSQPVATQKNIAIALRTFGGAKWRMKWVPCIAPGTADRVTFIATDGVYEVNGSQASKLSKEVRA